MLAQPATFWLLSTPSKPGLEGSGGGVLSCLSLAPQVLTPVACVWIISALLGLRIIPPELSTSPEAPWVWLPHPGRFALRPPFSDSNKGSISLDSRLSEFYF